VDAFFSTLRSDGQKIMPKSKTGEAISYCLNQEKYLRVFLEDGNVPIDNNAALCEHSHNFVKELSVHSAWARKTGR
jgi:hypothetical protein